MLRLGVGDAVEDGLAKLLRGPQEVAAFGGVSGEQVGGELEVAPHRFPAGVENSSDPTSRRESEAQRRGGSHSLRWLSKTRLEKNFFRRKLIISNLTTVRTVLVINWT